MAINPKKIAIQTITVGSSGTAGIEFANIPQTYTDLLMVFSVRSNNSSAGSGLYESLVTRINDSTTNSHYISRVIRGDGTGGIAVGNYQSNVGWIVPGTYVNAANVTASSFSNFKMYFTNYTNSNQKFISYEGISPANTSSQVGATSFGSGLYTQTNAITSIRISPEYGTLWIEGSTATLYGITSTGFGVKANGGIISEDADYFYHTFKSSGTFTPTQNISTSVLVVAGGGGGGHDGGGGGGAGGLRNQTFNLNSGTTYTITVGGGGGGSGSVSGQGGDGSSSSIAGSGITTFSATGGGGAGSKSANGRSGGSGGGGGHTSGTGGSGNTGGFTPPQGYAGGNANGAGGGGGGGASEVGFPGSGSPGGMGSSAFSSWGLATRTGENVNGVYYYAGGGAGGRYGGGGSALGGFGGGGTGGIAYSQFTSSGTANTGGGSAGGGDALASSGSSGGSGIVIIRYPK